MKGNGKGNQRNDGKGKKGDGKRGKSPGGGPKGAHKGSPGKSAMGNHRPNSPTNQKKEICQYHLKGKC